MLVFFSHKEKEKKGINQWLFLFCSFQGDINFARDLSDLRHRNGMNVVLVHGQAASEALKTCAHKAVRYDELLSDLPFRSPAKVCILNQW